LDSPPPWCSAIDPRIEDAAAASNAGCARNVSAVGRQATSGATPGGNCKGESE
jgi:hypothetical protein